MVDEKHCCGQKRTGYTGHVRCGQMMRREEKKGKERNEKERVTHPYALAGVTYRVR